MNTDITQSKGERKFLIFSAWISILLVSDLPQIIFKYGFGNSPGWLFWFKTGFLAVFLLLCLTTRKLRPLWTFACILLVFFIALAVSDWVKKSDWWINLIKDGAKPSFAMTYLRPYLRDIGVTLIVILALWVIKKERKEFFLVKGNTSAPVEPVRWLGIGKGATWNKVGWIIALVASVAIAIYVMIGMKPSGDVLVKCIPLIPAVLIFAAINAFNEEIYFRASILSTLVNAIGTTNALLINVVFFGLAHFLYGSPPSVAGLLMAGFLAYIVGKSMLETRGLFWPWLIHFLPDVIIFLSYAVAFVNQMQ